MQNDSSEATARAGWTSSSHIFPAAELATAIAIVGESAAQVAAQITRCTSPQFEAPEVVQNRQRWGWALSQSHVENMPHYTDQASLLFSGGNNDGVVGSENDLEGKVALAAIRGQLTVEQLKVLHSLSRNGRNLGDGRH